MVEVIKLRKIPLNEAKRIILKYLKEHPNSWASDIVVELGIDIDTVITALEELRKEGKVV